MLISEFTKHLDKHKNTYEDLVTRHFHPLQEIIGLSHCLLSKYMQLYCYIWLIRHILEIIEISSKVMQILLAHFRNSHFLVSHKPATTLDIDSLDFRKNCELSLTALYFGH